MPIVDNTFDFSLDLARVQKRFFKKTIETHLLLKDDCSTGITNHTHIKRIFHTNSIFVYLINFGGQMIIIPKSSRHWSLKGDFTY